MDGLDTYNNGVVVMAATNRYIPDKDRLQTS